MDLNYAVSCLFQPLPINEPINNRNHIQFRQMLLLLEGIYQDIFKDNITISLVKTLTNIMKLRDEYLEGNVIQ